MPYNKITTNHLDQLKSLNPRLEISNLKEDIQNASHDETEDFNYPPEAVIFAKSTKEVSQVLSFAYENNIPVTPRGAGTGLSGGALAVCGGIVLSLTKLNKIIEIDEDNLFAVVEPGVITQNFQEAVEKIGLFYPPDPASKGSCTLGGNLAECSGGPRALKYGVTKDYIYGVEAVLPNGDIIQTGGKLLKNVTGYNLTQLLLGSEGTLGVITKITIKLLPLPKHKQTLIIPFGSLEAAAKMVPIAFKNGLTPCAMEIMEKEAVQCASEHLGKSFPNATAEAQLLVELDGNDLGVIEKDLEKITELAMNHEALDVLIADTSAKEKEIWSIRRACGEAAKKDAYYKELDTVVPRASLPKLISGVKKICQKHQVTSICYGHAGDGNVHVNLLKSGLSDEKWQKELPIVTQEVFELTVSLGGTLSGEHGIGWLQKEFLPIAMDKLVIDAQRKIKSAWDPKNTLNPMKIFPTQ